ncbi:MAG TPA: hypothetical protein VET48_10735, partial [Steroidobacteraceae bacterium]|nr:hypothetical protein [Steroidobacteraceae bacterium]
MFRISNIRIGTKLSIMSGLGILLVISMVGAAMHSNSTVKQANEAANMQQNLARDIIDAKASIRGMQTGVRDIRLTTTTESLQAALKYLEARRSSAAGFVESNLPKVRVPENRERLEKVKAL